VVYSNATDWGIVARLKLIKEENKLAEVKKENTEKLNI
jgi:hypothetical protein